jgi:YD repeat-containing protein
MRPTRNHLSGWIRTTLAVSLIGFASVLAGAQTTTQFDQGTPPEHLAGVSQIGSYITTELGTVNLSNGALNLKIPLGQVGGRGLWLPLTLNYSSKIWSAEMITDGQGKHATAQYDNITGMPWEPYNYLYSGWSVGAAPFLFSRGVGIFPQKNQAGTVIGYQYVVTKLSLFLPDRGIIEFRDDTYEGQPLGPQYDSAGVVKDHDPTRGQYWHATDGSGMIFINDNISSSDDGVTDGDLSGRVITADGTQYTFLGTAPVPGQHPVPSVNINGSARCSAVTDRNGNTIAIVYQTTQDQQMVMHQTITYTDPLGRNTTIAKTLYPSLSGESSVITVSFPAYLGASQVVYTVKADQMRGDGVHSHYAPNVVWNGLAVYNGEEGINQGPNDLFQNSSAAGTDRIDTRAVVTQLILPDSRTIKFTYDFFGEVSEVTLPTGAVIDYTYAAALPFVGPGFRFPAGNSMTWQVSPGGDGNVQDVDRAVVQKVTKPDGATVQGTWTYTYAAQPPFFDPSGYGVVTTAGTTEVKCTDSTTGPILDEMHYFMDAEEFNVFNGGTAYTLWSTGLERRVEQRDTNSAVLHATEQDWVQRALINSVMWPGTRYPELLQVQNDNLVTESRRFLDDNSKIRTDTQYDSDPASFPNTYRANNPNDIKEYDFGGSSANLLRETKIGYNHDTNFVGAGSLRLKHLPLTRTVYDGNLHVYARPPMPMMAPERPYRSNTAAWLDSIRVFRIRIWRIEAI